MEEAVIQRPEMKGIVMAGSGANDNLSALCIQCNEGIMGECHRLDPIPNFIMFSSIALPFAKLSRSNELSGAFSHQ
jgi:hypothetical protein